MRKKSVEIKEKKKSLPGRVVEEAYKLESGLRVGIIFASTTRKCGYHLRPKC